MKTITLLLVVMFITGCSEPEQPSKATISNWTTACYDGVLYYDLPNRLAPAYNRSGVLKLCEDK